MLTADLVKVRRRSGKIRPVYLTDHERTMWLPVVTELIALFQGHVGRTADELDRRIKQLVQQQADQLRVMGFVKLLRDRCAFDKATGAEAPAIRLQLFEHAARVREALGIDEPFDRQAVLEHVADELDMTAEALSAALFCDLPGEQPLLSFKPTTPTQLLQRYDLALAQGILLKAVRVRIHLSPSSAPRFRHVFRTIKFRRLMHEVTGTPSKGYDIELDGPMSLFESTQRYGLQLAMLLPVLATADGWKLQADVLWGKDRKKATFEVDDAAGLVSHVRSSGDELEEIETLLQTFRKLDTPWTVKRQARVFNMKGRGVFVPDLVFRHPERMDKVYLEVFGYWSREAVFNRVELLDKTMKDKFILAVSKKLRVSPEITHEGFPGEILVYTQSISARSVLRSLERITQDS